MNFCRRIAFGWTAVCGERNWSNGSWEVELDGRCGAALTFEFTDQMVGWPYFTIDAPAGTTVELMVQEAHQVGGPALLNSHFNSWARFICREGVNHFETFDFESCRWMQLHVHGAAGKVTILPNGHAQADCSPGHMCRWCAFRSRRCSA